MANQTLLSVIDNTIVVPGSWQDQCINVLNASNYDWRHGLVDSKGQPMTQLNNATWGITIIVCEAFCNHVKIPFVFNFQSFASAMTNYFLPWLALTAQLPFETGSLANNIMAFCMAVGSPALVTYSLTITILNRYWVRKAFDDLQRKARTKAIHSRFGAVGSRVQACRFLLQEAQQVPLRASMQKGWFSSLIVIPANSGWWTKLERTLKSTRRGVTASLVSQMLFAGIAYLFTVIASFMASLGDPATALQIASGSVWIWLIPVIAGWITVGTQYSDHSIEDALEAETAYRAMEPPIQQPGQELSELSEQLGLIVRQGLSPLPHNNQTVRGGFDVADLKRLTLPTWFGGDVGGDEQLKGPIFNYARLFTWSQLASSMSDALWEMMEKVSRGEPCGDPNPAPFRAATHIHGDSAETAAYAGLSLHDHILAYPAWTEIPTDAFKRIIGASFTAMFLQWGTIGASILIAYRTPTVGLGCRTASYSLYGILGTVSWFSLLASMLLSHEVMLRYQEQHRQHPTTDFRRHPPQVTTTTYTRTWSHSAICGLAVVLRLFGKLVAVLNTLWLIASSLMEFIGGYDNCWCMGNYIGMGNKGWVVLFKGATDLAAAATLPWGGGLALTLMVCSASYIFFFFGSRSKGSA